MNKCDCYETRVVVNYTYHPITGQPIAGQRKVGICNGTKEQDHCSCQGDRIKCDFYPEVRKEARKKLKTGSVESLRKNWATITEGCSTNKDYKEAIFSYLNIK